MREGGNPMIAGKWNEACGYDRRDGAAIGRNALFGRRRSVWWSLALCLGLAACGSGGSDQSTDGSARIDGSVYGSTLDPLSVRAGEESTYVFVFTNLLTTFTAVEMSEGPGVCADGALSGRAIYLSLFQNATLARSVVTEPGRFEVWLPDLNGQTSPGTGNAVVFQTGTPTDNGGRWDLATSGSVEVTKVSGEGIEGRFDVIVMGERLTGSFEAPACDPWTRSGNIP